jgi:ABC-type glycerol-3-phosphate transport system permease component
VTVVGSTRRRRPNYRLRRNLAEVAALAVGIAVLIWTLVPIYNIVIVALEPHGDVFTNDIWPAKPSLESFWVVVTQGYWYLEYFWEQFGNSLYIGVATVVLTLLIGSLTSFSIGRMRTHGDACDTRPQPEVARPMARTVVSSRTERLHTDLISGSRGGPTS